MPQPRKQYDKKQVLIPLYASCEGISTGKFAEILDCNPGTARRILVEMKQEGLVTETGIQTVSYNAKSKQSVMHNQEGLRNNLNPWKITEAGKKYVDTVSAPLIADEDVAVLQYIEILQLIKNNPDITESQICEMISDFVPHVVVRAVCPELLHDAYVEYDSSTETFTITENGEQMLKELKSSSSPIVITGKMLTYDTRDGTEILRFANETVNGWIEIEEYNEKERDVMLIIHTETEAALDLTELFDAPILDGRSKYPDGTRRFECNRKVAYAFFKMIMDRPVCIGCSLREGSE